MSLRTRTLWIAFGVNLALIFAAILHGLRKTGDPTRYFGEGRFTMIGSCVQLLLVAVFSLGIHRRRRKAPPEHNGANGHWLWLLIAAGFAFLACDEAFQFHERMDQWVHHRLGIEATSFTDRLDDAIIAFYALVGLGTLWVFRREVLRFRLLLLPLMIGVGFAVLAIACDALTNRKDVLRFIPNPAWVNGVYTSMTVGDGAFTLLAEGMFVAAFFLGWKDAENRSAPNGR